MTKSPNEQFGKQEAERRFEAALRGAFKTPPMPMKSLTSKRRKSPRRSRKTLKESSA